MGINAMLSTIKNNASQLKSRSKFKGLDEDRNDIYPGKVTNKKFTPEQIQATKDAFQKEVKKHQKKTFITAIITALIVPLIILGLIELHLFIFV